MPDTEPNPAAFGASNTLFPAEIMVPGKRKWSTLLLPQGVTRAQGARDPHTLTAELLIGLFLLKRFGCYHGPTQDLSSRAVCALGADASTELPFVRLKGVPARFL